MVRLKPIALICAALVFAVPPALGTAAHHPRVGTAQARLIPAPAVPELAVSVVADPHPCGGPIYGCTNLVDTVYVVDADPFVIAHETGHIIDHQAIDAAGRLAFLEAIGKPGLPWWGAPWQRLGGEDFADVYATCLTHPVLRARWTYSIGEGLLSGARIAAGCEAIAYSAKIR